MRGPVGEADVLGDAVGVEGAVGRDLLRLPLPVLRDAPVCEGRDAREDAGDRTGAQHQRTAEPAPPGTARHGTGRCRGQPAEVWR